MLSVKDRAKIRRLHREEGMPIKVIAREEFLDEEKEV